MVRALRRPRVDAVGIGRHPVEARPDLAVAGVDRHVVDVLLVGGVDLEVPDEARDPRADGQPHQAALDGLPGDAASTVVARFVPCADCKHAGGRVQRDSEVRSRARDRAARGSARACAGSRRGRQPGQERVVDADDAAVAVDVDVELGVVDRQAAVALAQVDVGRARDLRVDAVGDLVVGEVGLLQAEEGQVLAHVVEGDRHGVHAGPDIREVADLVGEGANGAGGLVEANGHVREASQRLGRLDRRSFSSGGCQALVELDPRVVVPGRRVGGIRERGAERQSTHGQQEGLLPHCNRLLNQGWSTGVSRRTRTAPSQAERHLARRDSPVARN